MDYNDLSELLKDWRRSLYARNRSPRTVNDYLASGELFLSWLKETNRPTTAAEVGKRELEEYLAQMQGRAQLRYSWKSVSPATVAKNYRNLQQLFRFLVAEEVIDRSPFERMSPPAVPEQPVAVLPLQEVKRLLDACSAPKGAEYETRFLAARDAAIIRLLLDTGMRVSELAGITLADVDHDTSSVLVTGKAGGHVSRCTGRERPRASGGTYGSAPSILALLRLRRGWQSREV